jgi:hypothetical protein
VIAKEIEKQKAIALRKRGYSYTQIREQLTVSKSTLSLWLKDLPLSKSRIDSLRGKNPQRIERFQNTMRAKREALESNVFSKVGKELGMLSKREKIIAGLFLYWGEGTKAAPCTTAVTNTDPDALKFFVHWLGLFGIKAGQLKVVLHLYKDMDAQKEMKFWSTYLDIPISRFRKPYIKNTRLCDITYKSGFGHGTCSVLYLDKDLYLYVKSALKYIRMRA